MGKKIKNSEPIEDIFFRKKINNIVDYINESYIYGELINTNKALDIKILNFNDSFASVFCCTNQDCSGEKITSLVPDISSNIIKKIEEALTNNQTLIIEEHFLSLNKYFKITAISIDKKRFIAFFKDLTESKKTKIEIIKTNLEKAKYKGEVIEQNRLLKELNQELNTKIIELNEKNQEIINTNNKLQESELKIRMAVGAAKLGIWDWNIPENIIYFDEMAKNLLEIPEELEGKAPYELFIQHLHPNDTETLIKKTESYLTNQKQHFAVNFRIRPFMNKDNTWFWFLSHGKTIKYNDKKEPIRMIGTYVDITQQRQTEEEIIQTRKFLELILDNTPSGIFTVDMKKRITNWNKRAEEILGYKASEVIGKKCTMFASKKCFEICELLNDSIEKPVINKECKVKSKNGQIKYIKKNINEIIDNEGNKVGGVESFEDITEIKNIEKKILQAIIETEEKERKHIAQEIHDGLGSMLSSIKIHMNMLQSKKIDETKRNEIIQKTNQLINETSQSARNIANYLRPSVLSDFGLIEAIEAFCRKVNYSNLLNINIKTENINNINLPQIFETNIYRIIQELINNTLKHANAENATIELIRSSDVIELHYKDDGIGIFHKINPALPYKGHGIKNIISRAKSIDADYVIGNNSEKGMFAIISYKNIENE